MLKHFIVVWKKKSFFLKERQPPLSSGEKNGVFVSTVIMFSSPNHFRP